MGELRPGEETGRIQCGPITPQHCAPQVSKMPLCPNVTAILNMSWAERVMPCLYETPPSKSIADPPALSLASHYPNQDPDSNTMETQNIPLLTKPTSHPNPDPDPGNH